MSLVKSIGKVIAKAPGKVGSAIRKHPFRSLGTTFGAAAGVCTAYEIIDQQFLSSTPSA
jgi:hypothetical protein